MFLGLWITASCRKLAYSKVSSGVSTFHWGNLVCFELNTPIGFFLSSSQISSSFLFKNSHLPIERSCILESFDFTRFSKVLNHLEVAPNGVKWYLAVNRFLSLFNSYFTPYSYSPGPGLAATSLNLSSIPNDRSFICSPNCKQPFYNPLLQSSKYCPTPGLATKLGFTNAFDSSIYKLTSMFLVEDWAKLMKDVLLRELLWLPLSTFEEVPEALK